MKKDEWTKVREFSIEPLLQYARVLGINSLQRLPNNSPLGVDCECRDPAVKIVETIGFGEFAHTPEKFQYMNYSEDEEQVIEYGPFLWVQIYDGTAIAPAYHDEFLDPVTDLMLETLPPEWPGAPKVLVFSGGPGESLSMGLWFTLEEWNKLSHGEPVKYTLYQRGYIWG